MAYRETRLCPRNMLTIFLLLAGLVFLQLLLYSQFTYLSQTWSLHGSTEETAAQSPIFVSPCPLQAAVSEAISRSKTLACKNMMAEVSCTHYKGELYATSYKQNCPLNESHPAIGHDVETKPPDGRPVRIVFAMMVHGRAVRQLFRLFKAIYRPQHYYYFHVDSRSEYMYNRIKLLVSLFPNVALTQWRMATIWGGASLLQTHLRMIEDLITQNQPFDFWINMSESDFIMNSIENLELFLSSHRQDNFLKPHGRKTEEFIRKQGMKFTFVECDEHMYRLDERPIPNIHIDGGSDWVVLNRKFAEYIILGSDSLLLSLKGYFKYSLLPAESFYHTLLRNSHLCMTYSKTNLRFTNWNRARGCHCQYKAIVDWCGCSPNNILPEDFEHIKSMSQTLFFARKFEAVISQQIISMIERNLLGSNSTLISADYYWENLFDLVVDGPRSRDVFMSYFYSFARMGAALISSKGCSVLPEGPPLSVHIVMHKDRVHGLLVQFKAQGVRKPIGLYEVLISFVFQNHVNGSNASRIQQVKVGTQFDAKELIFRNIGNFIGPHDEPGILIIHDKGPEIYYVLTWVDPVNTIAGSYQMKVKTDSMSSFHAPTFKKPLRPGNWIVYVKFKNELVATVQFLVLPLSFIAGESITLDQVITHNNGPPGNRYLDENMVEFFGENDDTNERLGNSSELFSVGSSLNIITDRLVNKHYAVSDVCQHIEYGYESRCGLLACQQTVWSSYYPDPKSDPSTLPLK